MEEETLTPSRLTEARRTRRRRSSSGRGGGGGSKFKGNMVEVLFKHHLSAALTDFIGAVEVVFVYLFFLKRIFWFYIS